MNPFHEETAALYSFRTPSKCHDAIHGCVRRRRRLPALRVITLLTSLFFLHVPPCVCGQKPPLTIDDFFNSVEIPSVQISSDGRDVLIETVRPDWARDRFRHDLWLYRDVGGGSLAQITESGHESGPQWSPDGHFIAFQSDERTIGGTNAGTQVYVMSIGGEMFPVTFGDEEVHTFAWSANSRWIYFATRNPRTKKLKDAYSKEWKDVVQFRESERGDTVFSVAVTSVPNHGKASARPPAPP